MVRYTIKLWFYSIYLVYICTVQCKVGFLGEVSQFYVREHNVKVTCVAHDDLDVKDAFN